MIRYLAVILIALTGCAAQVTPQSLMASIDPDLLETRYCGEPKRDISGRIVRRTAVITAFKRIHPCPATGLPTGACTGWSVDHVMPLSDGYCDAVSNLQWLPNVLKSGAGHYPKDRWERKINGDPQVLVPMPESGKLSIQPP